MEVSRMPKLAEALLERKALQEKFKRLSARLVSNAKVQEGEQPDERPSDLLQEAGQVLADIKRLTMEINRTNMVALLPGFSDGTTLMGGIAVRDRLRDERNMLEQVGNAG